MNEILMVSTKTVEACNVRKGMLVLIDGHQGPRLVTKREKWNSTHCRIYYEPAPMYDMGAVGFVYVRLNDEFVVYDRPVLSPAAALTARIDQQRAKWP